MEECLAVIADLASLVASVVTVITLYFIYVQVQDAKKAAQGDVLLRLHEMFMSHNPIHRKLTKSGWKPTEDDGLDEVDLYNYLGLFERLKILMDRGMIGIREVEKLYWYRVNNLLLNEYVRGQIEADKDNWKHFISLCKSLAELKRPTAKSNDEKDFVRLCDELPKDEKFTTSKNDWRTG